MHHDDHQTNKAVLAELGRCALRLQELEGELENVVDDSSDGIRENRAELCRNLGERLGRYYE